MYQPLQKHRLHPDSAIYFFCATNTNQLQLEAKDVLPNTNHTQAAKRAEKCHLLSLVTFTFDLDIQTHPSKGLNTYSVGIWRKAVQQFPRDISYSNKKSHRQSQKQNLAQFTTCSNKYIHN